MIHIKTAVLPWAASVLLATPARGHITGWITLSNDAVTTANTITDVGNSTTIGGVEGYQALASFGTITLADGQFIELTGTYQVLGRTTTAASDLQRLRDQIRVGLFRAPEGDPLQAANLTGYIIEHRNEMREVRTPIGEAATGQTPFVSGRSSLINADTTGSSTGNYSTAAATGVTGGNPDADEFTEEDLVIGENVTLTITYRIARDGDNLDLTGSIAGSPAAVPPAGATPPSDSDGAFLEHFSALNYNPMIDLSGAGSDDFDFRFNRVGFLMGGNLDLTLTNPVADLNVSGGVNGDDLAKWKTDFETNSGSDADADGDADGADFLIWQQNVGRSIGQVVLRDIVVTQGSVATAAASAVPEPTVLTMLAAGGIATITARSLARRSHGSQAC